MTREEQIVQFSQMIDADTEDLRRAVLNGERANAHQCVDSIIDLRRKVEDMLNGGDEVADLDPASN